MPYENIVAPVLLILVLLVPLLKWAKDRIMEKIEYVRVGEESIPMSAVLSPEALQKFLKGEDNFLNWVLKMEPFFGDIPDYALAIERRYQQIVNDRVDRLYAAVDAFLKVNSYDVGAYNKVVDLFCKVSGYLSIGGLCAASAKMRQVRNHMRDISQAVIAPVKLPERGRR